MEPFIWLISSEVHLPYLGASQMMMLHIFWVLVEVTIVILNPWICSKISKWSSNSGENSYFHQVLVYQKCIVLNNFNKQQVILILVIFSLITGVDSSSTGTSSMKNFCPKRNTRPIPQQWEVCPLIEETEDYFTTARWIQSKLAVPGPSQQPQPR
jgi:hypothetical protein